MIDILTEYGTLYRDGFLLTLGLAALTFTLAFFIGLIIAAMRVSPVPPLNRFGSVYVSIFRNTPLVVLLILTFFGMPKLGIRPSNPFLLTGISVLSMYTGAYLSEAFRSGINTVDKGQAEAARAIGLNFRQVLTLIILPQAVRTVVGPIGNLFIANLKNTSVLAAISIFELTKWTVEVGNRSARPVDAFTVSIAMYVSVVLLAGFGIGRIEQRVAVKR